MLVGIFFVLIAISPVINSYKSLNLNEENFKGINENINFKFNEFIKYLKENKGKQKYTNYLIKRECYLETNNEDPEFVYLDSDKIIIIFKNFVNVNDVEKIKVDEIWYSVIDKIPELHAVLLEINREDLYELIEKLNKRNDVECAEINHLRFLSYEPNDPYWNESWGHKIINCDKAWDVRCKMEYVWLTILDTGIDADHEDLNSANIYQWDFIENDGTADDDTGTGHGTKVTGIALARMNNSMGIPGIAGNSPYIEVLKIFDEFKKTTVWIILKAIIYSIIAHAPYLPSIICMSFGNEEYNIVEESLFDTLRNGNSKILLVAAVGNSGSSDRIDYPAGYDSVIAVGAINESGCLCRYPGNWGSNYNKNKREVDIVAPGINIITTTNSDTTGKKYGYFNGTSAATAYIAGVAALWYGARAEIKDFKKRKNEPDRCEAALFLNAKSVGDKDPKKYGYGLVDAYETIPKLKSNKLKFNKELIKDILHSFSLLEKIYKYIFIKFLSTNDFLYTLILNNYIEKIEANLQQLGRTGNR